MQRYSTKAESITLTTALRMAALLTSTAIQPVYADSAYESLPSVEAAKPVSDTQLRLFPGRQFLEENCESTPPSEVVYLANIKESTADSTVSESDFRNELVDEILSFADLEFDWDGYHGGVPNRDSMEDAFAFVACLPFDCPPPVVAPSGDGEIGFVWELAGAYIDVGFPGNGTISFFARPPEGADGGTIHGDLSFSRQDIPRELIAVIENLHRLG